MTASDAARAAGWHVDARTADGAPDRATSPDWSRAVDDVADVPAGIPPSVLHPP